jgi:propionyl-CoA carboxylase alpha chain
LSENADFAEKAEQNNIILLGLSQKYIMGSKLAKEAVKAYNIPWFPLRRSHYRY